MSHFNLIVTFREYCLHNVFQLYLYIYIYEVKKILLLNKRYTVIFSETRTMKIIILLVFVAALQAETNTGSCKDVLQGYLTGQLSSALGVYQVEALRREFKSFTDVINKSMKAFKEGMKSEVKTRT